MKNLHKHHPIKHLGRRAPFAVASHHAKPVRRRHVFGLGVSALALVLVMTNGLGYMYEQYSAEIGASLSSRQELFAHAEADPVVTIRSTYGYGLNVDRGLFDVVATANIGGELQNFDEFNVSPERAYASISVSPKPNTELNGRLAGSNLTVIGTSEPTPPEKQPARTNELFDQQTIRDKGSYVISQTSAETKSVAGREFAYRSYNYKPKQQLRSALQLQAVKVQLLVGYVQGDRPLVIRVVSPVGATDLAAYDRVIASIFDNVSQTLSLVPGSSRQPRHVAATMPSPGLLPLLEKLGLSGSADAKSTELDNARIVAQNIPAVVKLYHVRCGAIEYHGEVIVDDSCSGATGTGFIISSDGLIATNGHVVAGDAKTTVSEAMSAPLLARMLRADGYSSRDITSITTDFVANTQMQASVVSAVRGLPNDAINYTGQKDFYLVAISDDVPNLEQLAKTRVFKETTTIKSAELKAIDYSSDDLTSKTGFSHSDIAVLDIGGSNYPVVRLGNIDSLVQGAAITVIGYPNDAESNGLVKNDTLQTSATEGIVSAIREVNGNNGKVIQSDVAIGHGNSGGPGFDSSGKVFGIATYLLDGTGGANGISYLRDVQDLKNVLNANNLNITTTSTTQTLWEQGLDEFYGAHYSKAIAKFNAVQAAYGPHVLADQYIGISKQKIASGDEAQSPFIGIAFALAFAAGFGALIYAVVLIVRHRAHHHMYLALQAGYLAGPFAGLIQARHAGVHITSQPNPHGRH